MIKPKHHQETAEEATLRMVPNPNTWPNWPVLPLKKRMPDYELELGYIFEDGGKTYKIYKGNVFAADPGKTDPIIAEFNSVEDMVLAGWIVD